MTTHTNMDYQALNQWLGQVMTKDNLAEINMFSRTMLQSDIGAVRALFEQLALLRPAQRQQIVQWGVWVQDVTLLQLLSWSLICTKRTAAIDSYFVSHSVSHINVSLKNIRPLDDVSQSAHWRRLLFAPYLVTTPSVGADHRSQAGDVLDLSYAD